MSMEEELTMNGQQTQQPPEVKTPQVSTPSPAQHQGDAPLPTKEYIQEITSVDLPDSVIMQFRIYLTRDWPLGNFDQEYTHELKWLGRTRAKEIIINHAPSNAILSPHVRAELYDLAPEDCLESLSHRQQMEIIDLGELLYARATRGENMAQQDQMGKTMSVNRDESDRVENNGGWLGGIFG